MVEQALFEVIKEAAIGKVNLLGDSPVNIRFDTVFDDGFVMGDVPVLKITDQDTFIELLKKYITLLNVNDNPQWIKMKIAYLFANATYSDFQNPIDYLKRRINFLIDKTLENETLYDMETLYGCDIVTEITDYVHETPYCFKSYIKKDEEKYELPTISYGISDGTCYIYAVQNYNKEIETSFEKKIKRRLYHLNEGVDKEDEISLISPAALLSLTLFLNQLQVKGISDIKVIPYLPIRYQAKAEAIELRTKFIAKRDSLRPPEIYELRHKLEEEQIKLQDNLTQKLIRNFYRLEYHFENVRITAEPWIHDETLNIKMGEFENTNNDILQEIISKEKVINNGKSL